MPSTAPLPLASERDRRAERGLRISLLDGCLYCVMVGVSESS
jgi:hypothetical protein